VFVFAFCYFLLCGFLCQRGCSFLSLPSLQLSSPLSFQFLTSSAAASISVFHYFYDRKIAVTHPFMGLPSNWRKYLCTFSAWPPADLTCSFTIRYSFQNMAAALPLGIFMHNAPNIFPAQHRYLRGESVK